MPTPINPASKFSGPCVIVGRGLSMFTKDDVVLDLRLKGFPIDSSQYGELEQREDQLTYGIRFSPIGVLADYAKIFPYGNRNVGEFLHLTETVSAVSATGNALTITAHRFRAGHAVRVASTLTVPPGLSASTLYYIGIINANTVSLHLTEAAAIALTSPVDITGAGTGIIRLIEQEPLTIWSLNEGRGVILHNVVVDQMPELSLAANTTLFGQLGYEAFRQHALAPTDSAAFFTNITVAPTYTALDPAAIITQPYLGSFGSAPWNAFYTQSGFRCTFGISTQEVLDDVGGLLTRRLSARSAEARFSPNGVSEQDVRALLLLQGAGAGRGRRMIGTNDLDITGTDLFVRLYKPQFTAAPEIYSREKDRTGDLVLKSAQTFTAGVPNRLFLLAAAAPT